MTYDDPAAPLASPDAVIKFVKDNGELSTAAVAGGTGYSVQFH